MTLSPADTNSEGFIGRAVHGALCLVTIDDNPPIEGSQREVVTLGLVDARKRLETPYRYADKYPGYCLGISAIAIPVSLVASLPPSTDTKVKVLTLARAVRTEYKAQASLHALLGVNAELAEMMLSSPPPPPWHGITHSSDGRGSNYLREPYPENGTSSVITLDDFFLSVNTTDPGPSVFQIRFQRFLRLTLFFILLQGFSLCRMEGQDNVKCRLQPTGSRTDGSREMAEVVG